MICIEFQKLRISTGIDIGQDHMAVEAVIPEESEKDCFRKHHC